MQLPVHITTVLQQAAQYCGWRDPRTVWLATLAVISLSPVTLATGVAVKRARATLRCMEVEQPEAEPRQEPRDRSVWPVPGSATRPLVFDYDDDDAIEAFALPEVPAPESVPSPQSLPYARPTTVPLEPIPADPPLLGEPTAAAGLYFLLQVLRRLGIPAALEACPALAEAGFVAHVLKQLAVHAGVDPDDPILLCLHPLEAEFSVPPDVLSTLWDRLQPATVRRKSVPDSRYLLRVWTLAVRRRCWQMGRITVREIVNRHGRVWLTRTDLDVTLPLAAAEIRIRRLGLDIDPGWLPWFGRVVRFHYRDREPEGPAC
jgi:hypothetical protein